MGAAVPIISGIATGLTALITSRSQASAIESESEFRQTSIKQQQNLQELRAKDAEKRGDREARAERRRSRKLIASQRASFAAQGVDVDLGTPSDLQEEARTIGAAEVATVKINAFREALGLRLGNEDLELQSRLTRIGGRLRSRSTLLSGGLGFVRALGTVAPHLVPQTRRTTPPTPPFTPGIIESTNFRTFQPPSFMPPPRTRFV